MTPVDQESSFSSRGSRMTADLSAFFSGKRRPHEPAPGLAPDPSQASTIPRYPSAVPSDSPAPRPRTGGVRVDADGFVMDDDEEDVFHSDQGLPPSAPPRAPGKGRASEPATSEESSVPPMGSHKRTPSAQAVGATPRSPAISSSPAPPERENRRSRFSLLEEHAMAKRNRVAAIRSSSFMGGAGGSAFDSGFDLATGNSFLDEPAENGSAVRDRDKVRNLSGKRFVPGERDPMPEPPVVEPRQPRAHERKVSPAPPQAGKGRGERSPEKARPSAVSPGPFRSSSSRRSPDKLSRSRTPEAHRPSVAAAIPKFPAAVADGRVPKQKSLETPPTKPRASAKADPVLKPAQSLEPKVAGKKDPANVAKAARADAKAADAKLRSMRPKTSPGENSRGDGDAGGPPRRKTGKTTFIKDWLGSAEPAPGEGPSIRFAPDNGAQKPLYGNRTQPRRLSTMGEDKEVEEEEEEPGRRDLAHQLSVSRNYDLRMVLEKERIEKESESFMRDLEDVAEAAEEAAAEMEDAKTMPMRRPMTAGPTVQEEAGSVPDSPEASGKDGRGLPASDAAGGDVADVVRGTVKLEGEEELESEAQLEKDEPEAPPAPAPWAKGRFRGRGLAAAGAARGAARPAAGIVAMSAELSSPDSAAGAAAAPRKWKGQGGLLEGDEFLEFESPRQEESAELASAKLPEAAPVNGVRHADIYSPDGQGSEVAQSVEIHGQGKAGAAAAKVDADGTAEDSAAAAAAAAAVEAAGLGLETSMASAADTGVEVVSACEASPREVSPAEMEMGAEAGAGAGAADMGPDVALESVSATGSLGGASGARPRDGLSSKRSGARVRLA